MRSMFLLLLVVLLNANIVFGVESTQNSKSFSLNISKETFDNLLDKNKYPEINLAYNKNNRVLSENPDDEEELYIEEKGYFEMGSAIYILFLLLVSNSFESKDKAGTKGFQFLNTEVGARSSALAGTSCVLYDANSVFNNPATLIKNKQPEIGISYNQLFANMSEQTISGIYPTDIGRFGIGILYLNMGEITGYDMDSTGNAVKTSNFTPYDIALVFSFCRELMSVPCGINLKLFQESIKDKSAKGIAVDIGFYKEILSNLMIGSVIQNFGPDAKFMDEKTPLPINYKVGVGYQMTKYPALITFDINKPIENKFEACLGLEYDLKNLLDLRLGYKLGNDYRSGISLGVGISKNVWNFDFAFIPYKELGNIYRLSLSTKFGKKFVDKKSEQKRYRRRRSMLAKKIRKESISYKPVLKDKKDLSDLQKKPNTDVSIDQIVKSMRKYENESKAKESAKPIKKVISKPILPQKQIKKEIIEVKKDNKKELPKQEKDKFPLDAAVLGIMLASAVFGGSYILLRKA